MCLGRYIIENPVKPDPKFLFAARKHFAERNLRFQNASHAYARGDKFLAKHWSTQGHFSNQLAKKNLREAARHIFWHYNYGKDIQTQVDLHGLWVKEARGILLAILERPKPLDRNELLVITGSGKYKLATAVRQLCFEHQFKWQFINVGMCKITN